MWSNLSAMTATLDEVLRAADTPDARQAMLDAFLEFLRIDNTVSADLAAVRANEAQAFELICRTVERIRGSRQGLQFLPIDPEIEDDPYYTPCHYTKTPDRPEGLGAAAAYEGRSNLVLRVPGQGKGTLAFNAHIDVVSPYIPPRVEGGIVHGRGSCDDKGGCAAMLLALYFIEEARTRGGIVPPAESPDKETFRWRNRTGWPASR